MPSIHTREEMCILIKVRRHSELKKTAYFLRVSYRVSPSIVPKITKVK